MDEYRPKTRLGYALLHQLINLCSTSQELWTLHADGVAHRETTLHGQRLSPVTRNIKKIMDPGLRSYTKNGRSHYKDKIDVRSSYFLSWSHILYNYMKICGFIAAHWYQPQTKFTPKEIIWCSLTHLQSVDDWLSITPPYAPYFQ